MTKKQKMTAVRRMYSNAELGSLVHALEEAWQCAVRQPAHELDGFGSGVQPCLSEYGVLVALMFEDRGVDNAFAIVTSNRRYVEAAWDLGIAPPALVNHIITTR